MIDNIPKFLKWTTIAAAGLHIILSFVAALQNCTLRELGFFFVVMGILALVSVVWAAFVHPLLMLEVLLGILIPGMLMGFLTTVILRATIVMLFVAPLNFFAMMWEYVITHYIFIAL